MLIQKVGDVANKAFVNLNKLQQKEKLLVKTGEDMFDCHLGGLLPKDVVVLAGAPSTGKSETLYRMLDNMLSKELNPDADKYDMCMAGFILKNTLSDNGGVTRGVCKVAAGGKLSSITETFEIYMDGEGKMHAVDDDKNLVTVEADDVASMNMWGLPPKFLEELDQEHGRHQSLQEWKTSVFEGRDEGRF